jgi:hypothetical protein
MNKGKVKLYCGRFNHYATIWLDEIKNMEQNGAYWFIEMKDGNIWEDATNAVITYDENEKIGYFIENEN